MSEKKKENRLDSWDGVSRPSTDTIFSKLCIEIFGKTNPIAKEVSRHLSISHK